MTLRWGEHPLASTRIGGLAVARSAGLCARGLSDTEESYRLAKVIRGAGQFGCGQLLGRVIERTQQLADLVRTLAESLA